MGEEARQRVEVEAQEGGYVGAGERPEVVAVEGPEVGAGEGGEVPWRKSIWGVWMGIGVCGLLGGCGGFVGG